MKKYKNIILGLPLLLLASCDGKLDVTQPDVISAEVALRNLDDLETALYGAYAELRGSGLYGEATLWLPDLLADNLRIGNSNGGGNRREANWQYTSGTDIGTWGGSYELIFDANTVINNSDAFEDGRKKNRIVGQALALRALGHFELLKYYAEDYGRNSTKLAVPIVTLFEIGKPARNTVAEVYDQIFDDLLLAKNLLNNVDKDPQENGPFYFNALAVNALLARVSLYAGEWQDAVNYATIVINQSQLANPVDYASMWAEDTDGEVLFAVAFATTGDGRIGSDLLDNSNPSAPRSTFTLSNDMATLYDEVNDIRFNSFVLINPLNPPGANDQNDDVYLPFKYPGRGGERGLNNAKVLRVSEMYLIRAEAYANISGQDALGSADLNTLRASRITNYVNEDLSGQVLKDAIQVERRKELVAEGHRWFDLKRINQGVQRGTDCRGLTISCTLEAGNFRFVFPIPQSELDANENIIQNPGY
ncbi:RagB/SusD family nutrient uptake outer membrane protein [Jejuia spongiicola]|uniref:RagB/SusD family nutrient uptake outer membrane protein n=1 Tax=Jejuia spongiicola TaxID=2942207 RepID=A0ABT0QI68_9FLAO|nr:RagB/SusD family nutrient uptake outer membrane protein [Jejuia spongiicola]MCL6296698.1 RagB/SusD family nutrient uptake outer membrane protein [Jejuia spongiicola]